MSLHNPSDFDRSCRLLAIGCLLLALMGCAAGQGIVYDSGAPVLHTIAAPDRAPAAELVLAPEFTRPPAEPGQFILDPAFLEKFLVTEAKAVFEVVTVVPSPSQSGLPQIILRSWRGRMNKSNLQAHIDATIELVSPSGASETVQLSGVSDDFPELAALGATPMGARAKSTSAKQALGQMVKPLGERLRTFASGTPASGTAYARNRPVPSQSFPQSASQSSGRPAPGPQASAPPIFLPPQGDISAYGKFYALVIGNNDYKSLVQLRTAVADARGIGKILREDYGYNVEVLENASRRQILKSLQGYRRKLRANDNLLIYYAGHGWLDEGADRGYWLPVEASQDDNSDWISNADITDFVRAIEAKHVMIVSDSCYSGTLSRSINTTRGIRIDTSQPDAARDYFTRMSRKRTRVVLSSGGLEPVADSGVGGHSVFANAFMEALTTNEGVTDGATIFSIVRRRVIENADQTPTYAKIPKTNDQDGDFIFAKGK